jgi:O-antigen/teichoic acid export membrane protein
LTVGTFMLALLIGQIVASAVAIVRLPHSERWLAPWRGANLTTVFHFGFWRSAAQSVRPATLTAVRVVITAIAGVTLYGHLEAARVYMAPALLIVNGIGSFLLPMYVRRVSDGAVALVHRADKAALSLLVSSLVMGVLATALVPIFGTIVTGHGVRVSELAVFGWSVYAASCAAVMPYGSLAAVLGVPSKIMIYRVVEAVVSISVVWIVVAADQVSWSPLVMSAGPFIGGYAIRRWVLLPIVRVERGVIAAEASSTRDRGRHRPDGTPTGHESGNKDLGPGGARTSAVLQPGQRAGVRR